MENIDTNRARNFLKACWYDFHWSGCLWAEQGYIYDALDNNAFPKSKKEFDEFCYQVLGYTVDKNFEIIE